MHWISTGIEHLCEDKAIYVFLNESLYEMEQTGSKPENRGEKQKKNKTQFRLQCLLLKMTFCVLLNQYHHTVRLQMIGSEIQTTDDPIAPNTAWLSDCRLIAKVKT